MWRIPTLRSWLQTAPALLIAAVAAWEIARVSASPDVPSEADWTAAAAWLEPQLKGEEIVKATPEWLDPLLRHHLGDQLSIDMLGRMDDGTREIIWVLSARGAEAAGAGEWSKEEERQFGRLTVTRYRQAAARVETDFRKRFARARPRIVGPVVEPVVDTYEEVDFRPRRCLRIVPRPETPVRLRFADAPLADTLVGHIGLADVFARKAVPPGRLEVLIAGETVAEVTVGRDDGWVRFEAPTQAGRATVEFVVTATGQTPRQRIFCLAAQARGTGGG